MSNPICCRAVAGRWARAAALAAGGWLLSAAAMAEPMPDMVSEVLDRGIEGALDNCAYTRTSIDSQGTKTERFDPTEPEHPWVLLSVDKKAPTAAELRRYGDKADGRADRLHPLAFDLGSMVAADAWELRSESAARAEFNFRLRPSEDIPEPLVDKVLGTLVVDKHRLEPVLVRIENTEPAYVAPLVRIAEYVQELRFDWSEQVGAAVLVETVTHRRGRALGFKSLRKDRVVEYYDYLCRSASTESAGS